MLIVVCCCLSVGCMLGVCSLLFVGLCVLFDVVYDCLLFFVVCCLFVVCCYLLFVVDCV